MTRHDIPNLISILRLLMVVPIVWTLQGEDYRMALGLFALAGVSDALDGYLAKRYGWTSRLGSILDPLADKALLMSTYVTLGFLEQVPWALVVAIIARDVVIFSGALAYHILIGRFDMAPSLLSKVNTFAQIILALIIVVTASGVASIPQRAIQGLTYAVFGTTVLSGLSYVWIWGHQATRAFLQRRHYG